MNDSRPLSLLEIFNAHTSPRDEFYTMMFNLKNPPQEYHDVLEDMLSAIDFVTGQLDVDQVRRFCGEAMVNRGDYNSPFWTAMVFTWQLAKKKQRSEKIHAGGRSGTSREQKALETITRLIKPIEEYLRRMGDKSSEKKPLKKIVINELLEKHKDIINDARDKAGSKREISAFFTHYIDMSIEILSQHPESLQGYYGLEIRRRAGRSNESKERSKQGALKHHREKNAK